MPRALEIWPPRGAQAEQAPPPVLNQAVDDAPAAADGDERHDGHEPGSLPENSDDKEAPKDITPAEVGAESG